MVIFNTILSKKDAKLIENTIIRYGRIVNFNQIKKIFKEGYSLAELKNRLSLLSKIGWFIRIKRGLYVIVTDIGSLSTNDIAIYTICQALNKNSYISFENALKYHGMFDQMFSNVCAVTPYRARKYKVQNAQIQFFKIKKDFYFGFSKERSDIGLVNIAKKEKAILDILYFRSNAYYVNLIWERLNDYKHDLDFHLLKKYAMKFNTDIIRQIGFFLDRIGIDTKELFEVVKGKTSYNKMTKDSSKFDSKWRLYFDDSIVN